MSEPTRQKETDMYRIPVRPGLVSICNCVLDKEHERAAHNHISG